MGILRSKSSDLMEGRLLYLAAKKTSTGRRRGKGGVEDEALNNAYITTTIKAHVQIALSPMLSGLLSYLKGIASHSVRVCESSCVDVCTNLFTTSDH